MTPNIPALRAWYDWLRDPSHQQTSGRLGVVSADGTAAYCCLGGACEVAVRRGVVLEKTARRLDYAPACHEVCYAGVGSVLPSPVMEFFGVNAVDPELRIPLHLQRRAGGATEDGASILNDACGFSFAEIAECVAATWPEILDVPGTDGRRADA